MKVKKKNGLRRLSALLRKPLLTKRVRRHAQVTQDRVRMNTGQKVMFCRIKKVQVFFCVLPVPCVYIMETVCYMKLNNEGLKQNLAKHDYKT